MSAERGYLLKLFGVLSTASLLVVAINALVDPYRLAGTPAIRGLNEIKPRAGAQGAASKALAVERIRPQGLILGNSRAEVGLDPRHGNWPAGSSPTYNLALPGTGIAYSLRYLQHTIAIERPRTVVLGIDFLDFLVNGKDTGFLKSGAAPAEDYERLLAVGRDMARNPGYRRARAIDLTISLVSLDGLWDSMITFASQRNPAAADITELGFNPMRDYADIAKHEGYAALFQQKDNEYMKSLLRRPKAITADALATSRPLEELRQIILLCQANRIDLRLVIYPYHAHFQESLAIAGFWPLFEEWKGHVVRLIASSTKVTLYDFSGYHEFSTEAVPAPGARTAMRWYWESGHFKKELGDQMLARIFNAPYSTDSTPGEFGTVLSTQNLRTHLAAIRTAQADYTQTHPTDVARINALFHRLNQ